MLGEGRDAERQELFRVTAKAQSLEGPLSREKDREGCGEPVRVRKAQAVGDAGKTGSKGPGDTSKRKVGPGWAEKEQQWACPAWRRVR